MNKYFLFASLAFLAACASQPVEIQSPKGPVVCQLYTSEYVAWDRAISYPSTMNRTEADRVCLNQGVTNLQHLRASTGR